MINGQTYGAYSAVRDMFVSVMKKDDPSFDESNVFISPLEQQSIEQVGGSRKKKYVIGCLVGQSEYRDASGQVLGMMIEHLLIKCHHRC